MQKPTKHSLHDVVEELDGEEVVADVACRKHEPAVRVPPLSGGEGDLGVLHYLVLRAHLAHHSCEYKKNITHYN